MTLACLTGFGAVGGGCRANLQDRFLARGYDVPLHVERRVPRAQFGFGGGGLAHGGPACSDAPQEQAALARAVASVDAQTLWAPLRRACPRSEAILVAYPFFTKAMKAGITQLELAMRVECYGTGEPLPGVSLEEASHWAVPDPIRRRLQGWLVYASPAQDHWVKLNYVRFALANDGPRFIGFLFAFDPYFDDDMIIPEWTHTQVNLMQCGTGYAHTKPSLSPTAGPFGR